MEVRKAPRILVRLQSHRSAKDYPTTNGTIIDLSLFGCRISSDMPVNPGSVFTLRMDVPGYEEPIEIERADVRWVRGREFGLSFLALTTKAYECLIQVIQQL